MSVVRQTLLGVMCIEVEDGCLVSLQFCDEAVDSDVHDKEIDIVVKQIDEYARGERKEFDVQYEMKGTPFQKEVWNELCAIPYGETMSYSEIAEAIGRPKAVRAVASAIAKNQILIVVPCHRVIAKGGRLAGYRGGIGNKEKLLNLEIIIKGTSKNSPNKKTMTK